MPLILSEDLPGFFKAAVQKGDKVLGSSFKDQPEDDIEFRGEFLVSKVEWGDTIKHCISSGAHDDSEEITIPNPVWGQGAAMNDILLAMMSGGGKKQKMPKTLRRKRFQTTVRFIVRKLDGIIGINIEREDWKKIAGKKHKKMPKTRPVASPFGFDRFGYFDDDEDEAEPQYEIPGMKDVHTRSELSLGALEIDEVTSDPEQNCLTITFKKPLRLFKQTGTENKNGKVTYNQVEDQGALASSSKSKGGGSQPKDLTSELAMAVGSITKVKLFFNGSWAEGDMFSGDGEGEACHAALTDYLQNLHRHDSQLQRQRQAAEELRKRKQAHVERACAAGQQRFSGLSAESWARRAVEKFNLDVGEETGFFDPAVLDEEWELYFAVREKAADTVEKEEEQQGEESSENDMDEYEWDTGAGEVESLQKRTAFQHALRKAFASSLEHAGLPVDKAKTAADGLFLKHFHVCEDGGPCPRTVEVHVRIYSAVGAAMAVEIEYHHHDRARMTFVECFAHLNARVLEVKSPEGNLAQSDSVFQVVDDLAGKREEFSLFSMQGEDDGNFTYSLGRAADAQGCMRALFGEGGSLKVLDRDAFCIFMHAAGVETSPCNNMTYCDLAPLEYIDIRFPAEGKRAKRAKVEAKEEADAQDDSKQKKKKGSGRVNMQPRGDVESFISRELSG